jgi:hypothetical protein
MPGPTARNPLIAPPLPAELAPSRLSSSSELPNRPQPQQPRPTTLTLVVKLSRPNLPVPLRSLSCIRFALGQLHFLHHSLHQ